MTGRLHAWQIPSPWSRYTSGGRHPVAGGGGGGRPDLAQAGARDTSRLREALETAERVGREALEGV